jgi:hypothetical protein
MHLFGHGGQDHGRHDHDRTALSYFSKPLENQITQTFRAG